MEERCYRNEYKHIISQQSKCTLSSRLKRILPMDENSGGKSYLVKSLYFDTIYDNALREKLNGDPFREKFRIRCYNNNYSFLRLEKKVKEFSKGYKLSARVTVEEARKIIEGDIEFLKDNEEPLLREFYIKSTTSMLEPKVIIEYEREAYTYRPGNTRVTLDFNLRSSIDSIDFFNNEAPLINEGTNKCILEVKFDKFLPDIIRDLVQVNETTSSSCSKYLLGRKIAA